MLSKWRILGAAVTLLTKVSTVGARQEKIRANQGHLFFFSCQKKLWNNLIVTAAFSSWHFFSPPNTDLRPIKLKCLFCQEEAVKTPLSSIYPHYCWHKIGGGGEISFAKTPSSRCIWEIFILNNDRCFSTSHRCEDVRGRTAFSKCPEDLYKKCDSSWAAGGVICVWCLLSTAYKPWATRVHYVICLS